MSAATTRDRLLDAAEALYADRGIDATSLRAITAAADANLAAVHYHFGSKEALTEAVLRRRIEPLNAERLRLLEAAETEAEAGGEPVPVDEIVAALLLPALRLGRETKAGGDRFVRLMGRIYSEPGEYLRNLVVSQFRAVFERFGMALARSLPDLPRAELMWRLQFTIGAMVHTIADPAHVAHISGGLCDPSDVDGVGRQLVKFVAAGLEAPAEGHEGDADPEGSR